MITVARPVPDLSGFFKLLRRYTVMQVKLVKPFYHVHQD